MTQLRRSTSKRLVYDWNSINTEFSDATLCYELSEKQVAFLLYQFRQAFWDTRWENYSDFDTVIHFIHEVQAILLGGNACGGDCPECPSTSGGSGNSNPCFEIIQNGNETIINITEREDCMVTINVYENGGGGCGCGCGGGTSETFGGGSSSGGGGAGGTFGGGGGDSTWLTEQDKSGQVSAYGITQCDFISYSMPAIRDSLVEFCKVIDDNNESLESALGGIADIVSGVIPLVGDVGGGIAEWVAAVLSTGSAAVVSMLQDNDYLFHMQETWAKVHGSDGNITSVTRDDFLETLPYYKYVWWQGNAVLSPRIIMEGLWRILSINKVNARLLIAKGQANDELCAYVFANVGQTYEPSPSIPTAPLTYRPVNWLGVDYKLYSFENLPVIDVGNKFATPELPSQILAVGYNCVHSLNGSTSYAKMEVATPDTTVDHWTVQSQDGNQSTALKRVYYYTTDARDVLLDQEPNLTGATSAAGLTNTADRTLEIQLTAENLNVVYYTDLWVLCLG